MFTVSHVCVFVAFLPLFFVCTDCARLHVVIVVDDNKIASVCVGVCVCGVRMPNGNIAFV